MFAFDSCADLDIDDVNKSCIGFFFGQAHALCAEVVLVESGGRVVVVVLQIGEHVRT